MALRLAGEEFSVVRGLDALGWPREVEANDANPGLKITQGGSGPALQVVSGDIALGANKLKTTSTQLVEMSYSTLAVRNATDSDYQGFRVGGLGLWLYGNLEWNASGYAIMTENADNSTVLFKARDNGVGTVEIARLQSNSDPCFQATLPMVLNPSSQPGALVQGHFWYDTTAKKLKFYNGTAVETVTSA